MTVGKITLNQISPTITTPQTTVTDNSKNLQNQLTTKQQHLNRLTSDSKLSDSEKEKKRQEIQKEIDDLNRKLELARLKKEEAEKEAAIKQQKADAKKADLLAQANSKTSNISRTAEESSVDKSSKPSTEDVSTKEPPVDATSSTEEEKSKRIDMPIEDVQKMLTADYELQKELNQKHVDEHIDATVNKINAEIKQDTSRDVDTSSKEAEIEAIRTKENFWTAEANKQIDEPKEPEAHTTTGINLQAQITVDTI